MIRRHHISLPIRIALAGLLLAAVAIVMAYDGRDAPRVAADPAFGTVRPSPSSAVILENYYFVLPVGMTTCTDNAVIPSGTATSATSTTLSDTSKSWTTNQWAGFDVQVTSGTGSPQWRIVASNTSNTLTLTEAWGGIVDSGTSEGGSTTTLVDTGSNWLTNEFAGMTLEMPALGPGQTRTITSNTADTLTVSSWTTHVPTQTATDGTSTTLVDTTGVNWSPNAWANKTVQITAGSASGQSRRIVSNTNNSLTIENTWTTSAGGTATSATSTTLTDATQSWTPSAFNGMRIDILSGPAAGQSRTITANTATEVTISSAWSPSTPGFGDAYRIVRVPDGTTQYIVRDGPAIGTAFQVKQAILPTAGSGYQIFKSACRPGGYDITVTYNDAKFDVAIDAGISTGGNTSTTFKDTSKVWKVNQWAGSRVNITGGAGLAQSRRIVSNTANTLTVSPAWGTPMPTSGSVYNLGGIQDGGFVDSTGRTLNCPGGSMYGSNFAEIHCVTLGTPPSGLPQGPTGFGNLATVAFQAIGRGLLTFTVTGQVLEVDSTIIPADILNGTRRVILCPDSGPPLSPDGRITSIDQGVMAQAYGHTPTSPPPPNNKYTIQKDPSEDGVVSSIDQGLMAAVFLQWCVQP